MSTTYATGKTESGVLVGSSHVVFMVILLAAIGKILFFGGTQFSAIIAISSYLLIVVTAWAAFRADKKANCKEIAELSNLSGLILSLFFPVIDLITFCVLIKKVVSFAKNLFVALWFLRRMAREVEQQTAIPKRSKAVKKYSMGNLQVGDKVRFNPPHHTPIEGVVARFNKKTVKVINKPGESWNVPYGLLTKLKPPAESRQGKSSLQLVKG